MTLNGLCKMAARLADRGDEFVKTLDKNGNSVYQGEARILFGLFRDAINEAYAEIARAGLMPGRFVPAEVPENREIDLTKAALHSILLRRAEASLVFPCAPPSLAGAFLPPT